MLVRIVKMTFQPEKISDFLETFDKKKQIIRNQLGCRFLELYKERGKTNVFFTYSYWDSVEDLENYRNSELFKNVWAETKAMFDGKPEAWSVDKIVSLT